jgi:hypothetical protein
VDDGHLVVALVLAAPEALVDLAHAHHAEVGELGGAQSPHARGAVDVNPLAHRPQDLLVPDRGHALEEAVDEPHHFGAARAGPQDVTLRGRWPDHGFGQDLLHDARVERRPREDDDHRPTSASFSRARGPGT